MYEPDKLFTREKLPEFSPAVVVEPWRKALMDAAELIRVQGHCNGCYSTSSGKHCAVGAINTVAPGRLRLESRLRLNKYLGMSVVAWNDARERKAAEVIAALEAAARS